MSDKPFETPILLLIFNRKLVALKVLEEIRKHAPKRLYIAADGPRDNNPSDVIKCNETREAIINAVDWDCDVRTFFREKNRGCGHAPAEAVSWFFESEEQGIILEDDVIPSATFFRFCEEMLNKYKHNENVMNIAGTNFLSQSSFNSDSYYFSEYSGNWGWASWRRAWSGYDYNISSWSPESFRSKTSNRFTESQLLFFDDIFKKVHNTNVPDIWDYQWWYHRLVNNGLGIIPSVNMTKNIGFMEDATHTFDVAEEIKEAPLENLEFPLKHPQNITVNLEFDKLLSDKYYTVNLPSRQSIIQKFTNRLFKNRV